MKIYIGSDHAGFELKEKIKRWLVSSLKFKESDVVDFGALKFDAQDDYPDFCRPVAEVVAKDSEARGVIIGGSGQGEAMVANRVKGARAAVYYGCSTSIVELSRQHNNANILSLGARFLSEEEAIKAIKLWLDTPFSGEERHIRRIGKF